MKFEKLSDFNNWTKEDKDLFTVNVIKGLVIDGVSKANSGHPGGPMSLADFTYILYSEFLTIDPDNPNEAVSSSDMETKFFPIDPLAANILPVLLECPAPTPIIGISSL